MRRAPGCHRDGERRAARKGNARRRALRLDGIKLPLVMDHQAVALLIRWLHVAAMATILGGAVLLSWLFARGPRSLLVEISVRYEQLFWAALGVIVMTGVGNLGAFGLALPSPATSWGNTFIVKISAVVLLIAISLPRSLVVARLAGGAQASATTMRWLYGGTAGVVAGIAALAVWIAHG